MGVKGVELGLSDPERLRAGALPVWTRGGEQS